MSLTNDQALDWASTAETALIATGATNPVSPNLQGPGAAEGHGWTKQNYVDYYLMRYSGTDLSVTFKILYSPDGKNLGPSETGDKTSLLDYLRAGGTPKPPVNNDLKNCEAKCADLTAHNTSLQADVSTLAHQLGVANAYIATLTAALVAAGVPVPGAPPVETPIDPGMLPGGVKG